MGTPTLIFTDLSADAQIPPHSAGCVLRRAALNYKIRQMALKSYAFKKYSAEFYFGQLRLRP